MENLGTLRELQSTLDYLQTIEQALAALPPDLAALATRLKELDKQKTDKSRSLELAKELAVAQKEEDRARAALKTTSQKLQYTAAIRDLDEKERIKALIAKPLMALEEQAAALEQALVTIDTELGSIQGQFDELHAVFLAEHANQVQGRKQLHSKLTGLEKMISTQMLTQFHRLAGTRQGKVVVAVENGACTGCRVKLRGPLLHQLKEAKALTVCESCQRILFLP
jgi:hypothetical protein